MSIVMKLGKTFDNCPNVCKHDKFVHPNIRFLHVPTNLEEQSR